MYLDILRSTLWNLAEYKILFPVAFICCILTIRYYISYDFHKVLLIKLFIVECNYGYCKKCCWLYQLLLSPNYFLHINTYKIECCWALAVLTPRFSVKVFSNRIVQIILTNVCIFEYQLLLLYKVFLMLTITPKC